MKRLICWLVGHRASRYTDPKYAITYHCTRCCRLADGGMALAEWRR